MTMTTTTETTYKYSEGLLQGNYTIGNKVYLKNGIIQSNPFSKSIRDSLAAQWMLNNEMKAKSKIREVMKSQRLGTHEVDECYDYAVSFFFENQDKDFDKDYFGKEGSTTYHIDIYCFFQLKMIVYSYRDEMKRRLKNTVSLVTVDTNSANSEQPLPRNCISYNLLKRQSDEDDSGTYTIGDVAEHDELQYILDVEVPKFDKFFKLVGLQDFKFREYIYYMFLDDSVTRELNASQLSTESLNKVAKNMGESSSWLIKINGIVRNLMMNRSDFFGDVPPIILNLVTGRTNGWIASATPVFELNGAPVE